MSRILVTSTLAFSLCISASAVQTEAIGNAPLRGAVLNLAWPIWEGGSEISGTARTDLDDCLASGIKATDPSIEILEDEEWNLRDALYPMLEPSTQPNNTEELSTLLKRADVQERLREKELNFLVTGMATVSREGGYGIHYIGGVSIDYTTTLELQVWDLDRDVVSEEMSATRSGNTTVLALLLIIPIPLSIANTEHNACGEVAASIIEFLRK